MPFGLMNASSAFYRMMDADSKNISFPRAYLDGVVVELKNMDEHKAHLQKTFAVMSRHRLKLIIFKCKFAKNKVGLPGHIVSSDGVAVR